MAITGKKYYKNTLPTVAGFEVTAIAPLDSRLIVEKEEYLGGDVNGVDVGTVDTWNDTPCYLGMTVYVVNTEDMWVLIDMENGQTPKKWMKLASTRAMLTPLMITGDDL